MQKSGFSGTMTQCCPIKPFVGDSIGRKEQTYYSDGTMKLMGESVASFCGTPPWVEYPDNWLRRNWKLVETDYHSLLGAI